MKTKPFVKWVGGKKSLLKTLEANLPPKNKYKNYYEPFIGGGALLFCLRPQNAFISDVNKKLISTYSAIKDDVKAVIDNLKTHKINHSKEYFLEIKNKFNDESEQNDYIKIAGYFIYLNKTCFNGLYRTNKKGLFNVPFGKYDNPNILDETNLKNVNNYLQYVSIENKSFEKINIEKNSFYYFDPPYHKTYTNYDKNDFKEKDQIKLFELCNEINKVGSYFMLSNSNTDFINNLYKDYNIKQVEAKRSVSCLKEQRKKELEIIVMNY